MRRFSPYRNVHSVGYEWWLSVVIAADLEKAGFTKTISKPVFVEAVEGAPSSHEPATATYDAIASELGVSAERVRQIERGALAKLRRLYTEDLEPRA